MRFGVLGPVAVWTDAGLPVRIPGRKVRALLADLLAHAGRPVPADRLIDDIWGERPPPSAQATLLAKVSQLRRALEDAEPGGRDLVVSGPAGFALRPAPDAVDARRFSRLTAQARGAEPRVAAALLAEALELWRGPALADFADAPFAAGFVAHLADQRLEAQEDAAELRLELGQHAELAGELIALVAEHPLRERLRGCAMRALYRAGRQAEALATYQDVQTRLADELGIDPSPELAALHQAILTRDPALDPTPPTAGRRRGNLPAARTELVGRDSAVIDVRKLLGADRLVTLTGPGGVGKTRLALAAAEAAADDFDDGAWLVELAAAARPGDPDVLGSLAEAALSALNVRVTAHPGQQASPPERLADVLRPQQLLLVLDNCEHVVEHVADLVELLLRAAPGLRVLATSREPLALAGEVVWSVAPLDVPLPGADDPAHVADSSAARLFVARAAAAATSFRLDADTAAPIAVLCRRLDGIPLALELAATRVRALGLDGVVARLDDRFRLLGVGHRGAPPRQQTLQAMIDWSWELLTSPEQVLLRRLAVHIGGATADAVAAVSADDDLPACDVPDLLARLVDRSLVEVTPGAGRRFRLLESVAEYSLGKLHDAGEDDVLRRRHADHYLALAEETAPGLHGAQQPHRLALLDAETANLRAAIAASDSERALRLVTTLCWYWVLRGRLDEARRALDTALALDGPAPAGLRATAVAWRAGIALMLGLPEASAAYAAGLPALDAITDPVVRARATWFLADTGTASDLPSATELFERALAISRACGDRWTEGAARLGRARLAHVRGDLRTLEREAGRAAELFRETGDRWGQLQATCWLGALAELGADHERAAALHREGLRWCEELGLWPEVSSRLAWLGWIATQSGDHARARAHGERALAVATEQGFHDGLTFARIVLGYASRRQGRLDAAQQHLDTVLDGTPRCADIAVHLPMVLTELGFLAELRGDPHTAFRLHGEAYDLARKISAPRDTSQALEGLAAALAAAGSPAAAATVLGAAAAARAAAELPTAPAERADVDRATAAARAVLGRPAFTEAFEAGGDLTPDEARVHAERALSPAV
ncbi:LuxR family transcriptional regulator [Pseudonocardia hierapolitana]|uniref:LuxR family transcriptional regulator n=1 Tax=Pseudonocardia hierapolitana TaxID=1128676 RepID=A0A561ST55_9PSEU|nr:BTAD domain-containing putative transcriptional regulator [Pseudonocardia hierapolitana]TWF78050.1 LuxR family transcriptional regulator [Pseudonocardia hierapolitana]